MRALIFPAPLFTSLIGELTAHGEERAAIALTSPARRDDGTVRILVREVRRPKLADYTRRAPLEAELSPSFVGQVAAEAKRAGLGLLFLHSHPGEGIPEFSSVDDRGERVLRDFLERREMAGPHSALVCTSAGCRARLLGTGVPLQVSEVGERLRVVSRIDETEPDRSEVDVHERQVRALGGAGQSRLRELHVCVVGIGGTGSVVAQELALLGVGALTLVDHDVIEPTNLNRLIGATPSDVDKPKVEVVAREIRRTAPTCNVQTVLGSVLDNKTARRVADCDFVFCCTDTHGSRAILTQLAYQYLVPCIDVGVVIRVRDAAITHIAGRIQLLAPSLGCLVCSELLDPNQVRHDLASPEARAADPYFDGAHAPQPAVVSFNATVSSLAVSMMLAVVTDVPLRARLQLYDALAGTVRPGRAAIEPGCIVCSPRGALARGDQWPLPGRSSS